MTFKEYYLIENVNIKGNIKEHEKLLYEIFINFVLKKLKINPNINIVFKNKMSKKFFGYFDILSFIKNPNEFIDIIIKNGAGYKATFKYLAHELTHIKQAINNELNVSDDNKILLGIDNYSISVLNYSKLQKSDFNKYKEIPFENEAYNNEKIVDDFINSVEFKNLRNVDDNLKFIVDNI
jgi:hypothetical protein